MSPLLTGFPFATGGIGQATITSTTGSPTVDTSSRPGKTIYKFTGSGSITVGVAGYVEILCIAGGGSGGAGGSSLGGGGGGAGGLVYNTSIFVPTGISTITVGGGANGVTSAAAGKSGNPSQIGSYIAYGGGAGLGQNQGTASSENCLGGSGGGTNVNAPGIAILSGIQGYNGGQGITGAGGGGGGAGAVGVNAVSSNVGTAGGAGAANSITGSSVTYAGGGGGAGSSTAGSGGSGIGGNGSTSGNGANGTVNTGSGGGATAGVATSGNGGSGYVVVVTG